MRIRDLGREANSELLCRVKHTIKGFKETDKNQHNFLLLRIDSADHKPTAILLQQRRQSNYD